MNSTSPKLLLVRSLHAIVLMVVVSLISISARAADASGAWKWSFTLPSGDTIESSVDLKQNGNQLSGTYHSSRGGESPVQEGKINGDQVSFAVTRQVQDREFKLNFQGKIAGDAITGKVTMPGGDREFEWQAKREAKPVDPTGSWKWTMQRQNADPIESVLKLERQGDRLTGTISGAKGREIAITDGTIKGNEIAFKVERRGRQGQATVAAHTGRIVGDKIEGQISTSGGARERTRDWVATRVGAGADPTGSWEFTLETPDQNYSAVLELKRDGEKLTGRLITDEWQVPIAEGQIKEETLTFTTFRETDDGARMAYRSTAKMNGDVINGKVEFTRDGEPRSLVWTAKRK